MNINKSATLNETLFPVKEVPAIWNNESVTVAKTGYKFIVRKDTGKVLSCMTDEYKMIPNEEVMDKALPIFKSTGAKLRECSVYGDGRKTLWRFAYPDTKIDIGGKDLVNPEVGIINSYDGTTGLQTWGGAFRLVCSNGLVIGIKLTQSNNKHSVWNEELNKIEERITNTIELTSSVLTDVFPILKETKIRNKHILDVIKMLPTYAMETLTQYLMSHKPKTYWDLLNALTYITTHNMGRQRLATLRVENEIYPKIINMAKGVNKVLN